MSRISLAKQYAPVCAHPHCNNKVSYHSKYIKTDGTPGWHWKTFCDQHRTVKSADRAIFMRSKNGCENRYGDLGLTWVCRDPDTPSLTTDHWDGNKHNNDQDNIVILCANCHNRKTKLFGDTSTRYKNYTEKFDDFFEYT